MRKYLCRKSKTCEDSEYSESRIRRVLDSCQASGYNYFYIGTKSLVKHWNYLLVTGVVFQLSKVQGVQNKVGLVFQDVKGVIKDLY